SLDAQGHHRLADHRECEQHPDDPAPGGLRHRQPRDDPDGAHDGRSLAVVPGSSPAVVPPPSPPPTRPMNGPSSLERPASPPWPRPPAATIAATTSGTRSAST